MDAKGAQAGKRRRRKFRSGFVAILGRPNAGKSTLLNVLAGSKLAIVSSKPQTTRTTVQGVVTTESSQIVFIDTPGVHRAELAIHKRMMDAVKESLDEPDLILWLVDASRPFQADEIEPLGVIRDLAAPKFLLLAKIDLVRDKNQLMPLIDQYNKLGSFQETFPISALTGDGMAELRKSIEAALPEGPQYFPDDHVTDQPERFMAAERIREQVLNLTEQEVPHAVAVAVDQWEASPRLVRIAATIYVEREGQKRIVVGRGGAMLKMIGTRARLEIEPLLDRKVFLELFVKVQPKWRESPAFLDEIDWRRTAGGEQQ